MKKQLILSLFLVSFVFSTNAQLRFGAKAGGNISKMTMEIGNEDNKFYKSRLGFHIGGVGEYSFSKHFALQFELLFVQNGSNLNKKLFEDVMPEALDFEGRTVLNQIQLPVYAKVKYPISSNVKLFAQAGFYVGYIFDAKMKLSGRVDGTKITEEYNLFDDKLTDETGTYDNLFQIRHWNGGLALGAGVELSNHYVIGLDYKHTLSDMSNAIFQERGYYVYTPETKMYNASLSFAYLF